MSTHVNESIDVILSPNVTASEVAADLDEIYLGNLGTVDANLELPTIGQRGTLFTWQSLDTLYITDEGAITRPLPEVGNRDAAMRVLAMSQDRVLAERIFDLTILAEENTSPIVSIDTIEVDTLEGIATYLPTGAVARKGNGDVEAVAVEWEDNPATPQSIEVVGRVYVQSEDQEIRDYHEVKAHIRRHRADMRAQSHMAAQLHRLSSTSPRVTLSPGSLFYDAADQQLKYLLSVDPDQMLVNFRATAGLSTKDAPAMTGWDARDSKLRGHTTGHYLSALALGYWTSRNEDLLGILQYCIKALAECQDSLHSNRGCKEGFLAAYDETPFDLLEEYSAYPTVWAPYYTQDKILSGLLDAYEYAGVEEALDVGVGMGLWTANRLGSLDKNHRSRMWATYIAGEYGGLMSTLLRLYRLSGNPRFAQTATFFANDRLLYPVSKGVDVLGGLHANQHIPQVTGALDLFTFGHSMTEAGTLSPWPNGLQTAENFWEMATQHHAFVQGGVGETEMFKKRDAEAEALSMKSAETCASYSLMKLSTALFTSSPHSKYMDYYDRTLTNHIVSTYSWRGDGGSTYFFPLCPGGKKSYDTSENTCCHGSGLENPFRFQENIVLCISGKIYVNLYIPGTYEFAGCTISIETPSASSAEISVSSEAAVEVNLRRPDYAEEFTAACANRVFDRSTDNGYVAVSIAEEDEAVASLSWSPRFEAKPSSDNPSIISMRYGPEVLAAISDSSDWICVNPSAVEKTLRSEGLENLRNGGIIVEGIRFVPLNMVRDESYHVYFRQSDK